MSDTLMAAIQSASKESSSAATLKNLKKKNKSKEREKT